MDSGSPPQLPPVASLPTYNPFTEILNGPKARNLGSDFDDNSSVMSGSVTSMASMGKAAVCAECKQPKEQPAKPFIKCPKCRKNWHQCCLENCPKMPSLDWVCGSCYVQMEASKASDTKRRYRSSTSNLASTPTRHSSEQKAGPEPPARVPGETPALNPATTKDSFPSSTAAPNKPSDKKVCEALGCTAVLFNLTLSSDTLCLKHKIEQRHAKAVASVSAQKSTPASVQQRKDINKRGLHHMRPIDREVMKEKEARDREAPERKRPDIRRNGSACSVGEARPKSPGSLNVVSAFSAPPQGLKSTIRRPSTGEIQTLRKPSLPLQKVADTSSKPRNTLIASEVQTQKSGKATAGASASRIVHPSPTVRSSPQVAENYSPQHEPPLSQVPPSTRNLSGASEENNRPNANMAPRRTKRSTTARDPELTFSMTPEDMVAARNAFVVANQASLNSGDPLAVQSLIDSLVKGTLSEDRYTPDGPDQVAHHFAKERVSKDIDMTDGHEGTAHRESEAPQADGPSPGEQLQSPGTQLHKELAAVTVSSPAAQANEPDITGPDVDPEAALKALSDGWVTGQGPRTTYEKKLARGDFDELEIDHWIAHQRDRDDDARPTQAQLEAQNWGHFDPRVVWPKEPYTHEQRAMKIREIEARGGRKAQFGKVFTAQNLQEKVEKGWEIHQRQDKRDDEATRECGKVLEQLFGIDGIDNFVPATRNGRLVMVEREQPEEEIRGPGRRKRKREPRVFSVYGQPNH